MKQLLKWLVALSFTFIIFSKEKTESIQTIDRRSKAFLTALMVVPISALIAYLSGEDKSVNQLVWIAIRSSLTWYFLCFYIFDYPWFPDIKRKKVIYKRFGMNRSGAYFAAQIKIWFRSSIE